MRIARFMNGENPAYGIIDGDELVVLRSDPIFDSYATTGQRVPLDSVKLLSPMIPRSKVLGVAANFRSANLTERPEKSTYFMKPNTAVIGPDDPVVPPAIATELYFEPEIAVIIGRIGKSVPRERVNEIIFGYTVANDMGAANMVKAGDWVKGKVWDTSCPLGPWIETDLEGLDEGLAVRGYVDGELVIDGNSRDMFRDIAEQISELSDMMTLLPGDIILSGTPVPTVVPRGSRVDVEVEGIGRFSNPIVP